MNNFADFLCSLNIGQLKDCLAIINSTILAKSVENSTPKAKSVPLDKLLVKDFVEYHDKCVPTDQMPFLEAELESLNLMGHSSGEIKNQFISCFDKPYSWDSNKGRVVNNPLPLDDFPVIKSIMSDINSKFSYDLNSVFVSYYKTGNTGVRWHSDNEAEMDSSQPICVLSVGSVRQVEFIKTRETDLRRTCLTLQPADGSLYTMHAGCQENFRHRVRRDLSIRTGRFSLSFRRYCPPSKYPDATQSTSHQVNSGDTGFIPGNVVETPETPVVSNLIAKFNSPVKQESPITSAPGTIPTKPDLPKSTADGYSPFPTDTTFSTNPSNLSSQHSSDKVCVIFGTSITSKIDGDLLSRKKRAVFNCSLSGARIEDISELASDFSAENPNLISKVDKVIVNVGTNDIKNYNSHSFNLPKRFRWPLHRLVDHLKFLFPNALITFNSVLPMKIVYNYTVDSFHIFNRLLLEICSRRGCVFLDCFGDFLDWDGRDINYYLYRDKLHLSDPGLRLLCRIFKHAIYNDIFNPTMRVSFSPRYYHYD